ncbi:hypothetical protein K7432_000667 [Basidiobolus ranarum]|uniref:F-box domain-containing protein n=1 Tax=Basidiobolus ranarum TaxID=34480 RepID=A0ABR2WAT9_9FUNG
MFQITDFQNRKLPNELENVDGEVLDLEQLTKAVHVVLITVRSSRCPIGPQLFKILKFIGLENEDPNQTFTDPFTGSILTVTHEDLELNQILLRHDSLFLILLPGNKREVSEARSLYNIRNDVTGKRNRVEFLADGELNLAPGLGLSMSNTFIYPAIFNIQPDTLQLIPIKIGLSPGYYGYHSLITFLATTRLELEVKSLNAIAKTESCIEEMSRSLTNLHPNLYKNSLPVEILERICSYLNGKELEKVYQLSTEWCHIAFFVWRSRVQRITSDIADLLPKDKRGNTALAHTKPIVHQPSCDSNLHRPQPWEFCHRPKVSVLRLEQKLLSLLELISVSA